MLVIRFRAGTVTLKRIQLFDVSVIENSLNDDAKSVEQQNLTSFQNNVPGTTTCPGQKAEAMIAGNINPF